MRQNNPAFGLRQQATGNRQQATGKLYLTNPGYVNPLTAPYHKILRFQGFIRKYGLVQRLNSLVLNLVNC
jgi:hypothetical protein